MTSEFTTRACDSSLYIFLHFLGTGVIYGWVIAYMEHWLCSCYLSFISYTHYFIPAVCTRLVLHVIVIILKLQSRAAIGSFTPDENAESLL